MVAGYISKVESYGVIVRFSGHASALAPRPNIADRFVEDPAQAGFAAGDSVRCVVQRVDLTTDKAVVTFKPSIVTPSTGSIVYLGVLLRETYFHARLRHLQQQQQQSTSSSALVRASATQSQAQAQQKMFPAWQRYQLGSVVRASVTSVQEYGVVLLGDDLSTMMLARFVTPEQRYSAQQMLTAAADATAAPSSGKKGKKSKPSSKQSTSMEVVVLDVDYENAVLEVSLDTNLARKVAAAAASATIEINGAKSSKGGKGSKGKDVAAVAPTTLNVDDKDESAEVLLVKVKYLVVSVGSSIGYVSLVDYHHPIRGAGDSGDGYTVGQKLAVKCIRPATPSNTLTHGDADVKGINRRPRAGSETSVLSTTSAASAASSNMSELDSVVAANEAALAAHKEQLHCFPQASLPLFGPLDDTEALHRRNGKGGDKDKRRRQSQLQREAERSDLKLQRRLSLLADGVDVDNVPTPDLRKKFISNLRMGSLLRWEVVEVGATELVLQPELYGRLGMKLSAVLHLTGAIDHSTSSDDLLATLQAQAKLSSKSSANDKSKGKGKAKGKEHTASSGLCPAHPFSGISAGAKLWCYVLQVRKMKHAAATAGSDAEDSDQDEGAEDPQLLQTEFKVYLGMSFRKPTESERRSLGDAHEGAGQDAEDADQDTEGVSDSGGRIGMPFHRMVQGHGHDELRSPSICAAVVTQVHPGSLSCTVAFSPYLSATLPLMDISADEQLLPLLVRHCFVGLRLVLLVSNVARDGDRVKLISASRTAIERVIAPASTTGATGQMELPTAKDIIHTLLKSSEGNAVAATTTITAAAAAAATSSGYEEGQLVTGLLQLCGPRSAPRPPAVMLQLPGLHLHHLLHHKGSTGINPVGRVCVTELEEPEQWVGLESFFVQAAAVSAAVTAAAAATGGDGDSAEARAALAQAQQLSLPDGRQHGQLVQARVLSVNEKQHVVELSLRPSRVVRMMTFLRFLVVKVSFVGA